MLLQYQHVFYRYLSQVFFMVLAICLIWTMPLILSSIGITPNFSWICSFPIPSFLILPLMLIYVCQNLFQNCILIWSSYQFLVPLRRHFVQVELAWTNFVFMLFQIILWGWFSLYRNKLTWSAILLWRWNFLQHQIFAYDAIMVTKKVRLTFCTSVGHGRTTPKL